MVYYQVFFEKLTSHCGLVMKMIGFNNIKKNQNSKYHILDVNFQNARNYNPTKYIKLKINAHNFNFKFNWYALPMLIYLTTLFVILLTKTATWMHRYYLVFDGDVDALWVEDMNSVMDDNKLLTLPNGERIRVQNHCKLLFEVINFQPTF